MNDIIQMDADYKKLIKALKKRVVSARMRSMLAVNAEQIKLYWEIGKAIVERQKMAKWGGKLLEQISKDLSDAFPEMKGFSKRNLERMRKFAQIYPNWLIGQQSADQIAAQPVPQLPSCSHSEIVQQPVVQISSQPVSQLPWGHIIVLIEKIKDNTARDWYVKQSIENGWARDALVRHIQQWDFACLLGSLY